MSANKPLRMLPTWRGIIMRQGYGSGGDVGRIYCSLLAANAADTLITRHAAQMSASELPGCWQAAFRGALRRLNETAWKTQLAYSNLPPQKN